MVTEWTPQITVLNKSEDRIAFVATRTVTDNSDPLNPVIVSTWTSKRLEGIITTVQQKVTMMNDVWNQWQAYLNAVSDNNTLLGTLVADAKANLESREP